MKKIITYYAVVHLLFLNAIALKAQLFVNQAIIANGGVYEFTPPYQDKATVASFNPANNSYQVFDTIQVESVQDIVIDSNYAYVAAEDSIVKYNLNNLQREAIAYFQGIKKLEISGNYLMVGKWYGSGDFFAVYNKHNLQQIFSVSQVNETVNGMTFLNDTMYVAYNLKGTIDLYPPWGVFADSIGKLAVIHAPSQTFIRDIILGENAAGAGKTFTFNNAIYTICKETGYLFKYTPTNAHIDSFNLGIQSYIEIENGILYANFNSGIGAFSLINNTMLMSPSFNFAHVAAAYDFTTNKFYFTDTDYISTGNLYRVNGINGTVIDSFNIGVSCEAIALQYLFAISTDDKYAFDKTIKIYPNPFTSFVQFELPENAQVYVYDFKGNLIISEANISHLNTEKWNTGVYIAKIVLENDVKTFKLIKN